MADDDDDEDFDFDLGEDFDLDDELDLEEGTEALPPLAEEEAADRAIKADSAEEVEIKREAPAIASKPIERLPSQIAEPVAPLAGSNDSISSPSQQQRDLHAQSVEQVRKPSSVGELPLTVAVEIGRFQMTIGELMRLQPGNLLELTVHPQDEIDLVVNGKRIGRGELLRIGQLLGVRVTELG